MSDEVSKALENHKKGYNCAQAVACAFCDRLGMDERGVFRLMEPFGFGMGTMGTCGAVSAMATVLGAKISDGQLDAPKTKKDSYKAMRELSEKFKEKNESLICREIKGVDTGRVLRSCDGCVCDAAELLKEYLDSEEQK